MESQRVSCAPDAAPLGKIRGRGRVQARSRQGPIQPSGNGLGQIGDPGHPDASISPWKCFLSLSVVPSSMSHNPTGPIIGMHMRRLAGGWVRLEKVAGKPLPILSACTTLCNCSDPYPLYWGSPLPPQRVASVDYQPTPLLVFGACSLETGRSPRVEWV